MLNSKEILKYKKNGFIKISKILDKKTLLKIEEEKDVYLKKILNKKGLKRKLAKKFNFLKNPKKPSSLHRLFNKNNSYFNKVAKNPIFSIIGKDLMGKETKVYEIQFFFKRSNENIPTPMHQDNAYWNGIRGKGLSFWIALNDTNKKNGCLYYLKGSHKKNYKHEISTIPGSSKVIKKNLGFKKHFYDLKKGDCVVHDHKTIHGSFKNTLKKDRSAFIISFVTKNFQINKKKKLAYELKLKQVNIVRERKII